MGRSLNTIYKSRLRSINLNLHMRRKSQQPWGSMMLTEPNLKRASEQTLICPICERAVENHTELESMTCIHVGNITPIQHDAQDTITQLEACDKCLEQENALRQLWSLIQDRAHPTNFTWRCTSCNQERQLSIS